MSIHPFRSFFYPCLYPPAHNGYRVDMFNDLHHLDTMIYEVTRPDQSTPYTFIVCQFMDHEMFFHQIHGMDCFDMHADDRYFLARLWVDLFNSPYRPDLLSISVDMEDEPLVVRYPARLFVQRFQTQERIDHVADTLFEEVQGETVGR
jgi:hypothetical protein